MVGPPDVVQAASASGRPRSRCVALPREQRGWREAPRMRRSGRIGIFLGLLGSRAADRRLRDAALDARDQSLPARRAPEPAVVRQAAVVAEDEVPALRD